MLGEGIDLSDSEATSPRGERDHPSALSGVRTPGTPALRVDSVTRLVTNVEARAWEETALALRSFPFKLQ